MTLKELNQHLELLKELERMEEALEAMRRKAVPGAHVLTGMPKATGVSDRVGNLAAELADMEAMVTLKKAEIDRSAEEVTAFIETIDNVFIRTIFRLRFLRGLLWKEIPDIIGCGKTEKSVQNMCLRYLQKLQEEKQAL